MNTADSQPATIPQQPECNIAIAATFTAEPVKDVLSFWMEELELCRIDRICTVQPGLSAVTRSG